VSWLRVFYHYQHWGRASLQIILLLQAGPATDRGSCDCRWLRIATASWGAKSCLFTPDNCSYVPIRRTERKSPCYPLRHQPATVDKRRKDTVWRLKAF
jgi:hypothetical protein